MIVMLTLRSLGGIMRQRSGPALTPPVLGTKPSTCELSASTLPCEAPGWVSQSGLSA